MIFIDWQRMKYKMFSVPSEDKCKRNWWNWEVLLRFLFIASEYDEYFWFGNSGMWYGKCRPDKFNQDTCKLIVLCILVLLITEMEPIGLACSVHSLSSWIKSNHKMKLTFSKLSAGSDSVLITSLQQ